ncbi:meiotic recombination protein W68-like [Drosophila miranda]|uniref:meiotic recombination protein W68-like n=1 Tax=Drosophila miranda TaxID=7229 RepID=UPI0007E68059|nr:meiotic recombination protein W68-like [Drosophila miranda]
MSGDVEGIVVRLLASLVLHGDATFMVPQMGPVSRDSRNGNGYRRVSYNNRRSRHRFCLVVYMLAKIHRLQVNGGSYTVRGLYYSDPHLIRTQRHIAAARLDVCHMLKTSPTRLGVLSASKGLMAGDIRMLMTNGDVLDCSVYSGAIILPTDTEKVERIVTQADFVLVVEKESVFESLLARDLFGTFGRRCILVTGKGYPDCSTRRIVHRLSTECHLPAYILVDADPFGIEIMLVYRLGSQSMSFTSGDLATPTLRWIGLHPSEIPALSSGAVALSSGDNKKIYDILARDYIGPGVRQELRSLRQIQQKAEIESVIDFLSTDYIPNKINRNLFL